MNREIKLKSIIDTFKFLPLNFKPGEKYSYSGSGYILLAYIIEKVRPKDIIKKMEILNQVIIFILLNS
jgi:Beta-lactamase